MPPPDDSFIIHLVDRATRIETYSQLNQCNSADSCPASAAALQHYLETGEIQQIPLTNCPNPGEGYVVTPPDRQWGRQVTLNRIIRSVQQGDPGNHVVVHGQRSYPNRCNLAPDHYFNLAKIGPQCALNDFRGRAVADKVVWVDASLGGQRVDIWCIGSSEIIEFATRINCMRSNGFRFTRTAVTATLQVPPSSSGFGQPKQSGRKIIGI